MYRGLQSEKHKTNILLRNFRPNQMIGHCQKVVFRIASNFNAGKSCFQFLKDLIKSVFSKRAKDFSDCVAKYIAAK